MTRFDVIRTVSFAVVAVVLYIRIGRRGLDGPVTRRDLRSAIAIWSARASWRSGRAPAAS